MQQFQILCFGRPVAFFTNILPLITFELKQLVSKDIVRCCFFFIKKYCKGKERYIENLNSPISVSRVNQKSSNYLKAEQFDTSFFL